MPAGERNRKIMAPCQIQIHHLELCVSVDARSILALFNTWLSYALFQSHYFRWFVAPPFQLSLNFKLWQLIPLFVLLFPVLHRCHGNTQLRLQQNHNVQDEVLNPSSLLSTSRHTSDFRFVLRLLLLPTSVIKLCFQPKSSKDRRSLDSCAFAPPATLSADETELKGQPVEAPFIANLFSLPPPPPVFESALSLFYSWLHHPAVLTEATAGFRYTDTRPSASRTLFSLKLWHKDCKNTFILFVLSFFWQLSNGRPWRAEEETANLSFWPQPASTLHGSRRCWMGVSSLYAILHHL